MKTYSVLAVDDEGPALRRLVKMVEDHKNLQLVGSAKYSFEAKKMIAELNPDILLLDIQLKDATAFEMLESMDGYEGMIVFITAFDKYAIKAFELGAIDYLLKPYNTERFLSTIDRILKRKRTVKLEKILQMLDGHGPEPLRESESRNEIEKTMYIKSGTQIHKISSKDIRYIEKDGNYLTFHTTDKKILSRQNMKDLFDILNPEEFIRVHKSYVVSKKHLEIIESHQVRIGNAKIPVGRNYRDNLLKIME